MFVSIFAQPLNITNICIILEDIYLHNLANQILKKLREILCQTITKLKQSAKKKWQIW